MSNLTKLNDITARLWIRQMIIEMDKDPEASATRAHRGHELVYDLMERDGWDGALSTTHPLNRLLSVTSWTPFRAADDESFDGVYGGPAR